MKAGRFTGIACMQVHGANSARVITRLSVNSTQAHEAQSDAGRRPQSWRHLVWAVTKKAQERTRCGSLHVCCFALLPR